MEEQSFGIIPLRKNAHNVWEVLLIQLHAGHWSYPKGGAEEGESAQQSAERELFEETGLHVKQMLFEAPSKETYFFSRQKARVKKTVTYFVAIVEGTLSLQPEEVKDAKWIPLKEVANQITFSSAKAFSRKLIQKIASEAR